MKTIDLNDYSEMVAALASDTFNVPTSFFVDIVHAAIGISTEAGEILDPIKKYMFYGKPLDLTNLDEEMGDLAWYIQLYANARGVTLEHLLALNNEKLRKRYGDKFSEHKALNRDLNAERKILEQD